MKVDLTPDQLSELKELFVERYVDNMTTKDLVEYVHNDMTHYVDGQSEIEFLNDCQDYWDDGFTDIIEEIKEFYND
tara:strand:+ start:44 stop:271 length:228 start_codon:yes stop_codon:yes gene_type:complete